MKFTITYISKNGGRIGLLSGLQSNSELYFETPLSIVMTKGGSVPHLTQDIFNENFPRDSLICVPAQHFAAHFDVLQKFKKGVSSFAALKSHPVCCTVQDSVATTQGGFNSAVTVSVFGQNGRMKLCPNKYSSLIEVMQPDWYEALNDADTPEGCSSKRLEKSKKNSLLFLEKCLAIKKNSDILRHAGLFAPLLGGHDRTLRIKFAAEVAKMEVDGYALLGLHQNGSSAEMLSFESVGNLSKASLDGLPPEKPRQAQGAFNILSVLQLVENGIDIFDTSLPCLVAARGRALCFPNTFDHRTDPSSESTVVKIDSHIRGDHQNSCDKKSNSHSTSKGLKMPRLSNNEVNSEEELRNKHHCEESTDSENAQEQLDDEVKKYEIDLKDKFYCDSEGPLVASCSCYTCKTFSKAYVYHLVSVREMLGDVLLMIHNLHHWQVFFSTIREAIKSNQLHMYKNFLKKYMDHN